MTDEEAIAVFRHNSYTDTHPENVGAAAERKIMSMLDELKRFREREPLVQSILEALEEADSDASIGSVSVVYDNAGSDGRVYLSMWLRKAVERCINCAVEALAYRDDRAGVQAEKPGE